MQRLLPTYYSRLDASGCAAPGGADLPLTFGEAKAGQWNAALSAKQAKLAELRARVEKARSRIGAGEEEARSGKDREKKAGRGEKEAREPPPHRKPRGGNGRVNSRTPPHAHTPIVDFAGGDGRDPDRASPSASADVRPSLPSVRLEKGKLNEDGYGEAESWGGSGKGGESASAKGRGHTHAGQGTTKAEKSRLRRPYE